jgi:hypothetical protein
MIFWDWLLSFSLFPRCVPILQESVPHSFSGWKYTIGWRVCFSIHPLMNIWVVYTSWLLWTMLLCTFAHEFCVHMGFQFSGMHLLSSLYCTSSQNFWHVNVHLPDLFGQETLSPKCISEDWENLTWNALLFGEMEAQKITATCQPHRSKWGLTHPRTQGTMWLTRQSVQNIKDTENHRGTEGKYSYTKINMTT